MLGIGLPEPVGSHGGKTAKTAFAGLQRLGLHRHLLLQTGPIGDVDQRLGDKRAAALHGGLALEIEGARPGMAADEGGGKTGGLQPGQHHAGPARLARQRRQLGQLGRIVNHQGFTGDGAGKGRGHVPAAGSAHRLGTEVGTPPLPFPSHHIGVLKADKGFEHLDKALQYLFQRLGIGEGGHPAQQGLGLVTIPGLALAATHKIDQGGLQFVAERFQFTAANHLVACSVMFCRLSGSEKSRSIPSGYREPARHWAAAPARRR